MGFHGVGVRAGRGYAALLLLCLGCGAPPRKAQSPASFPFPPAPVASPAQQFVLQGDRYLEQKNYPAALQSYQQAAALSPNDAAILHQLSHCHYVLNDYDRAIETGQRSMALRETALGRNNLGWAYYSKHEYREAVRQLRRSIELDPGTWQPYDALAGSCYYLGWYDEALRAAETGLRKYGKPAGGDNMLDYWVPAAFLARGMYLEASGRLGRDNRFVGLHLQELPAGVAVVAVAKGGPADLSGILAGDIFTAAGGQRISTGADITRVQNNSVAAVVPVLLNRGGRVVETSLLVGVTPDLPARAAVLRGSSSRQASSDATGPRPARSIQILSLRLQPPRIAPGGSFDLVVGYIVSDSGAAQAELPVEFSYILLAGGKSLFSSPGITLAAPNSRAATRVEHLTASRQTGAYQVRVSLRQAGSAVEQSLDFKIE
jgi:hypothetical protein